MKIELDLPEIEGFEYTGEYRRASANEYYESNGTALRLGTPTKNTYLILKKKEPEYSVIDSVDLSKISMYDHTVKLDMQYVSINALEDLYNIADFLNTTSSIILSVKNHNVMTAIEGLLK